MFDKHFRSLFSAVAALSMVLFLAGCSDLAGLGTPASLASFDSTLAALTFQKADNSGVKPARFEMFLTPTRPLDATEYDTFVGDLRGKTKDPRFLAVVKSACIVKKVTKAEGGIAATLLLAWGQWAYDQVIGSIQSRIAKLKEAADPPAYPFRRVVLASEISWQTLNCLIVHRGMKSDAQPAQEVDDGLTAIIQRVPLSGTGTSTFRLIYLHLDNAIAVTAPGINGAAPQVLVDIALTVQSITAGADKRASVDSVTQFKFAQVSAKLGGDTGACPLDPDKPFSATRCSWESELIADPLPSSKAYVVTVSVKETGSVVDAATKAEAGLKALTAITTPAYAAWLKTVVTQAKL